MKEDFYNKLQSFLFENEVLPLSTWDYFYVNHTQIADEEAVRSVIQSNIKQVSGVYVYQRVNNQVLFVGVSKNLGVNMFRHYKASQGKISGDANSNIWHRFFSQYQEELIVYWMEIEEDILRETVGAVLRYTLKPLYNDFK